jgi:hypothetical protein
MRTADSVGQVFQPVRREGQTVNEWGTNKRMRTADGRQRRTGFPACQTGGADRQRMGNEYTNVDRGRQTAVGQAFQPVRWEGQTVNEGGNE